MARILVLHYSQTGQLNDAVRSMMAPLQARGDVEVVWQELVPRQQYPFPWPLMQFFDTFPESVYMDAPPNKPVDFDPDSRFDLVILAYQVWFLSPSLPFSAFLASPEARVLKDKPVITFIACRNMWLSAQQKMARKLDELGAHLIDNVVLIDHGPAWSTFITTPVWMLTGNKGPLWKIFPRAGVSEAEIRGASRFGKALADSLPLLQSTPPVPILTGLEAVRVNPRYIAGEKIAHRSFLIWGRLLRKLGSPGNPRRRAVLVIYILFLIVMILTVMPLGMIVRALLRPLMSKQLDEQVRKLELPSGSSSERMAQYGQQETGQQ